MAERTMQGRVVLITGAARGIGAATARELVRRGAQVALVGLEAERLQALAGELAPHASWHHADVTQQAALEAAVAAAVARFGRLDVAVTNAGIAGMGALVHADIEAHCRVLEVNLAGTFRTAKAVLPHLMASRGYLLLVSSAAAFSAMPGMSGYAASKAGVEQLANVLRLELAPHGVGVGSAHMTWIDTDMVRDVHDDLDAFRRTLPRLPGPFGTITSLEACAAAFADACARRPRRLFVPKALGVASTWRMLLNSAPLLALLRRQMAPMVLDAEAETRALGRAFGRRSMGMGEGPPDAGPPPVS